MRLLLFCLALVLSCAAPPDSVRHAPAAAPSSDLSVVLWFTDYNEVLSGTMIRYDFLRPRTLDVSANVGALRCVGSAPLQIVPPDASPPDRCDGIRGVAQLSCSDERVVTLRWLMDPDCSSGYGQGEDGDGNRVRMVFGGSPERTRSAVRDALEAQLAQPALPATGEGGETGGVATGTGFFVSWEGHLITNHHVIEGAERIQVKLDDGDMVDAQVVSDDADNDLALLRVDAIRRPLRVRRDNGLERGSEILVLGYPLVPLQGPDQKATFGHINALRGLRGDDRYTQLDAPVQPGNSGGPMLNPDGEVVGVVTAILNPLTTARATGAIPQNVNYALKSDLAHRHLRRALGNRWQAADPPPKAATWTALIGEVEDSVVLIVADH